jgi:poly-beta-1,6-N-acetyl-D-glucosamine synthase
MFTNDPFLAVTAIIFLISALFGFFWYLWFYLAPLRQKPEVKELTPQPVSVIICARNEAENLATFLPSVLEQDYPEYEVIVVNDCSDDNTYIVLGDLLSRYPNLRVSNVNKDPQFTHSKKFAQFIGIKAAHHELLLFTDADCKPVSNKWIATMISNFTPKTSFVLGYGGYVATKGLLNTYVRYDTLTIALQYTGMALRGIPYMGVGRNLAYRKSLFFESRGFSDHYHIASNQIQQLRSGRRHIPGRSPL